MALNYEKRYAYAEVEAIINWLGEEYINKIPKRIIQALKGEKKYCYKPKIDFNKPLENQVRQETKNMIAYLNYTYWIKDKNEKKNLEAMVKENARKEKEKRKAIRMAEYEEKAQMFNKGTVGGSIEKALKNNLDS